MMDNVCPMFEYVHGPLQPARPGRPTIGQLKQQAVL